jgi:regulator of RNase E activity RraA
MLTIIRNTEINHLAIMAEKLYNQYQVLVMDLKSSDLSLELTKQSYYNQLNQLKNYGIGGIIINGIFRDLTN